jgi:hypothetical protein
MVDKTTENFDPIFASGSVRRQGPLARSDPTEAWKDSHAILQVLPEILVMAGANFM